LGWSAFAAVLLWLVGSAMLSLLPPVDLGEARGLYAADTATAAFRWTGSTVELPIRAHTGTTRLSLWLVNAPWPGHTDVQIGAMTDQGPLANLVATPALRRYDLVLPPSATLLRLQMPVRQLAGDDRRWAGVQLFQVRAVSQGLSLWAIGTAGLAAALVVIAVWLLIWAWRRGWAMIAGSTMLGLALRAVWIQRAPPGSSHDEMVSLVDAWYLAQTGRDHLGNWWPLASFEAFGDWISPLLTYLELPWAAIFGPTPLVARLVAVACGTLAILAVYGLARALQMPRVAAGAAALTLAVAPWNVFLGRMAKPPTLVPLAWALCLWAAVLLVRHGRRRDAAWLAVAAGLGLYSYPTMKMVVPLLVGLAVLLALIRHGWRAAGAWAIPALMLALLWLPFAWDTLGNPSSGTRFSEVAIKSDSRSDLLVSWLTNYSIYFRPSFYFLTGERNINQGMPGYGVELWATAPFVLLGAGDLLLKLYRRKAPGRRPEMASGRRFESSAWWLIAGAILIAPLAASVTTGNPNSSRAAPLSVLYALLVGLGAAVVWQQASGVALLRHRAAQGLVVGGLLLALGWQYLGWWNALVTDYAILASTPRRYADAIPETMARVVELSPRYDEVWMDSDSISRPYIYLLAARPLPPQQVQASLVVERRDGVPSEVTRLQRYRFTSLADVPENLPIVEVLINQFDRPAAIIQAWRRDQQQILIVRGVR
jgi:4-amino-4-deoxy-L-arabinose transferase-like glycosyltransferase